MVDIKVVDYVKVITIFFLYRKPLTEPIHYSTLLLLSTLTGF